jgi:hypothetical protein
MWYDDIETFFSFPFPLCMYENYNVAQLGWPGVRLLEGLSDFFSSKLSTEVYFGTIWQF